MMKFLETMKLLEKLKIKNIFMVKFLEKLQTMSMMFI